MTPTTLPEPLPQVRALITRYFFGTAAAASACAAALPLLDVRHALGLRIAVGLLFAGLALACLAARRLQGTAQDKAVTGVALAAIVLIALTSGWMQWGINSMALGFFGLIACMVSAIARPRLGALVAGCGVVAAVALALAEQQQWIAGASAVANVPLVRRLLHLLILIGAGLATGVLLARVVEHYLRASTERERRFAGLLGIAADCYWEMDARFSVTYIARRDAGGGFVAGTPSGRPPWEEPDVLYDEDALDAHRALLEQWRPFRELHVRVLQAGEAPRHEMVSGEPRFDPRGVFIGYWGVSRDVTAEMRAREALVATEGLYHQLFTRIPTPLVLHDHGRVLDANPAAVALFGYGTLEAMLGRDIVETYQAEAVRQARERFDRLDQLPRGHALPVAEFRVHALDGRRLVVRATAVNVTTDGGAAALSIYLDDTERLVAEEAVRRSESLLSHLVATSPDVITLTDLASGRYAMANDTFLRLSGYAMKEVVGRTSVELGIWGHGDQRERLVAALSGGDTVRDMPCTFVAKSGDQFPLLVSAARFVMDGRDYLVINGRDMTEAERSRLEREAILENASIGIALTRDQAFQLANPRFEQMFGWPAGSLIGQSGRAVWADEDSYRAFGAEVGPALGRGEPIEIEREMRRFDGSVFVCRLQARAVDPTHPSRGGTIWIAEDVTGRRAVEQALAKARDDAEAASQAKSAFLANTSHEIRTPLNALVGLARLARQPDVDEPRRRQYLEQISDSAETLSAIISDILDLSKVEAGKLHLETVAFDLHALLRALHRGYATLADARGLALELQLEPGVPQRVLGDPVRVRQILGNYLTNALKFTPRGSVVVRACAVPGDRVRFEVADSGPGIEPEVQAKLFRPFTQADQSTTRRFGGTGLGLSICRELALLMGGDVGVASQPGEGSRFWAELPLEPAAPQDDNSGFGALDAGSPLAGSRVLMVEDNAVNMLIGVALLEQWGIKVEQAGDGSQAIAAVARARGEGRPFDAVLMDVQMPVMSGHEATRVLRRQHAAESLPIIALTAAALVSERDQALAAGMNDFLTKPIDAQRLHDALVKVVRQGA